MGVEVIGSGGEINGHGDTFEAFVLTNEANSRILLNVAEGKKKNAPRPPYNPDHPDNAWPVMVYSADPAKPEMIIGKSLAGVTDPRIRKQIEADNEAAYQSAKKANYRNQPYSKPQIAVMDPATEKLELKRKNEELQGQITSLNDRFERLIASRSQNPSS